MPFNTEYLEEAHVSRGYMRELKSFSMRDHKTKRQLAKLLRKKGYIGALTPEAEQRQLTFAWEYLKEVIED